MSDVESIDVADPRIQNRLEQVKDEIKREIRKELRVKEGIENLLKVRMLTIDTSNILRLCLMSDLVCSKMMC